MANRQRLSDVHFTQDIYSGEVQATTKRAILGANHTFTYGLTAEHIQTAWSRKRSELNLLNGAITNTVAGESPPNKSFPDTGTTQLGAYGQDEIEIGRLRLVPAIRLDC